MIQKNKEVRRIRIKIDSSKEEKYDKNSDKILTADSMFQKELKKHDIYSSKFLYTVIDGSRINEFLERGTYRRGDEIFAFNINQLRFDSEDDELETLLLQYPKPAIAVYNSSSFTQNPMDVGGEAYQFIDPKHKQDALEAVIEVSFV